MLNYILRRVLLMVPTLVGITFVVFMLLAASPGGIGAALLASGGGGAMQSSNSIAIQRAKLEDRYGLNEPALVQYWRWLGRISPVKFGQRDLVSPTGDLVNKPRRVPEPAAWQWFADKLPPVRIPDPTVVAAMFPTGDDAARAEAFRKVEHDYTDARAAFTSADALLRDALKRYVEAEIPRREWGGLMAKDRVRPARLVSRTPRPEAAEFKEAAKIAKTAIAEWKRASENRELLVAGMRTNPYPSAGIGLVPGVVSLALPDLGTAFSVQQPVSTLIKRHLPVTLMINLIAIPIIYMVAIPSGMLAAIRRGTWADLGLGGLYVALYSVPVVLAGVLALGFLSTPEYLNLFPAAGLHDKHAEGFTYLPSAGNGRGYLFDLLWHIMLPVLCIVYTGFAVLSKQTRAAMLENLNADYVRTAKAKGVANKDVIFSHVLRNSLLPLITMFVAVFPAMLAGSVVIERIFSVPGMGSLLIDAIGQRDRELILANTTIIAIVNLVALLLADILYALADPRITFK
jgi:ABC-type dipeptide/oligopeptide/nickel transport system permease component